MATAISPSHHAKPDVNHYDSSSTPTRRARPRVKLDDPFLRIPGPPSRSPSPAPIRTCSTPGERPAPAAEAEAAPESPTTAAISAALRGEDSSEQQESLLKRILLTPIILTSFVLSLFLVDNTHLTYRTRSRAHSHHLSSNPSYLSSFLPTRLLALWPTVGSGGAPDPYQNPDTTTWSAMSPASAAASPGAVSPGGWVVRKKHRAVARMEVGEALEMRRKVAVGLVTASAVMVGVVAWALWRGCAWLRG